MPRLERTRSEKVCFWITFILITVIATLYVTSDSATNASRAYLVVDWMEAGLQRTLMEYAMVSIAVAIAFMPVVFSVEGTKEGNRRAIYSSITSFAISFIAMCMLNMQMSASSGWIEERRAELKDDLKTEDYRQQKLEECYNSGRSCFRSELAEKYERKLSELAALPPPQTGNSSEYSLFGVTITLVMAKQILAFILVLYSPFGSAWCTQKLSAMMREYKGEKTAVGNLEEVHKPKKEVPKVPNQGTSEPKREVPKKKTEPKIDKVAKSGTGKGTSKRVPTEAQALKFKEAYKQLSKDGKTINGKTLAAQAKLGIQIAYVWLKSGDIPNVINLKTKKD